MLLPKIINACYWLNLKNGETYGYGNKRSLTAWRLSDIKNVVFTSIVSVFSLSVSFVYLESYDLSKYS